MTDDRQAIATPDETRGAITDIAVGVAAGIGGNLGTDGVKAIGGKVIQQLKGEAKSGPDAPKNQ